MSPGRPAPRQPREPDARLVERPAEGIVIFHDLERDPDRRRYVMKEVFE
jgi:hypothetical protein